MNTGTGTVYNMMAMMAVSRKTYSYSTMILPTAVYTVYSIYLYTRVCCCSTAEPRITTQHAAPLLSLFTGVKCEVILEKKIGTMENFSIDSISARLKKDSEEVILFILFIEHRNIHSTISTRFQVTKALDDFLAERQRAAELQIAAMAAYEEEIDLIGDISDDDDDK